MEETGSIAIIQVVNGKPAVTSLQVALAFGKEHKNVLADIRNVADKCEESFNGLNFQLVDYADAKGEKRPMYILSKDGLMLVTMGYTTPEAMKVKLAYIARFNEMEAQLRAGTGNTPMLPEDYIAALRALADSEEEKKLALSQRDFYKRTKAEIGCRREATAMATASAAVRKVNTLEDHLGIGRNYKQVKGIAWLLDEFEESRSMYQQVGKKLKSLSDRMGYEVHTVPTPEYPEGVKAYHVDVVNAFLSELRQDKNMLGKYRVRREAA